MWDAQPSWHSFNQLKLRAPPRLQLLAFVRRWRRFNTDLPGLLDEWAASLFRELDYRHEAANGVRFRELYGHMEVGCGVEGGWAAGSGRRERWH